MASDAPERCAPDQKRHIVDFLTSLEHMLPCSYCRESYRVFLRYLPPAEYVDGQAGFMYWVFVVHNLVNWKLDKPGPYPSFEEVVRRYELVRSNKQRRVHDPAALAAHVQTRYADPTRDRVVALMIAHKKNGGKWATLMSTGWPGGTS